MLGKVGETCHGGGEPAEPLAVIGGGYVGLVTAACLA